MASALRARSLVGVLLGKTQPYVVDLEIVEPMRRALTSATPFALRHMRLTIPVPHAFLQAPTAAASGALRRFARTYARSRGRRQLVIPDRSAGSRVVVICWGDNGAIGDRGVIGVPMTEAGGVVVVCAAAAAAGDVTVGPDFDWASAGPPKAETTQHPASNQEQAREILDTCTPPVRSVCLLWSTKATDWRRHGFRRRIGKAD
jgi:hypothetical protein